MRPLQVLLTIALASASAACGVTFKIHAPTPSGLRYAGSPPAQTLQVIDQRPRGKDFSEGRINVDFKFDGFEGEHRELDYLHRAVESELALRGIPVTRAGGAAFSGGPDSAGAQPITMVVRDFGVRNRQVTGWSPVVTFTRFSADFTRGSQTVRIAAYSKQVKTAIWGAGDIEGPCFNRPLHVIAGEVAAKLNQAFVNASADVGQVAALAAQALSATGEAQLQAINGLGWSNQPAALAPLVQLTQAESEEARGAALGALGSLGLPQSLATLQHFYQEGRTATDRYLALKAIGDLGASVPEALAFIRSVDAAPGDDEDNIREITKLYLEGRPAPGTNTLAQSAWSKL